MLTSSGPSTSWSNGGHEPRHCPQEQAQVKQSDPTAHENHQKHLVISPEQMKKFLYGTPMTVGTTDEAWLVFGICHQQPFYIYTPAYKYCYDQWLSSQDIASQSPGAHGGWKGKMAAIMIAWEQQDWHRIHRLFNRWSQIPEMSKDIESLKKNIQKNGWPKIHEGMYSLARK